MRIVARALQDERDNQVLFILKMPQQGSIETNNLPGKPFGRAQRVAVAAQHLARKCGNEFAACGAIDTSGRRRPTRSGSSSKIGKTAQKLT